jgi:serine/threonine-protein phosphatase 5
VILFLFLEGKYREALEKYKNAIESDPNVAIYYSNAATCYSRLGDNEKTLEMINEAIRLDSTFIKALYRRGVALMELKRFKEASEDFIKVCQEFPADVEAQKRLSACDKELDKKLSFEESMRLGFSAAIRVEKFELTRKCVEGMKVDVTYDGPVISFDEPLTVDWVKEVLIPHFAADKRLQIKYAYAILLLAKEAFEKEPSLVEVEIGEDVTMTICGDVHGQFFDLLQIFEKNGYPNENHKYVNRQK